MADEKKHETHKPADKAKEHKAEHKTEHKTADHKPHAEHKAPTHKEPVPKEPKSEKQTGAEKKATQAQKRAEGKTAPKADPKGGKPAVKSGDVKIVEKTEPKPEKHKAHPKPTLSKEQQAGLALRANLNDRRPWFRRQQWYEYKRLANSGWRKPRGVDSAMRRHFGYEQSVVRVGFGGPKSVRGLHPSGFQEVYVANEGDLEGIDPKTQAVRFSRTLGTRKLKVLYGKADKLGLHILNRRKLE